MNRCDRPNFTNDHTIEESKESTFISKGFENIQEWERYLQMKLKIHPLMIYKMFLAVTISQAMTSVII